MPCHPQVVGCCCSICPSVREPIPDRDSRCGVKGATSPSLAVLPLGTCLRPLWSCKVSRSRGLVRQSMISGNFIQFSANKRLGNPGAQGIMHYYSQHAAAGFVLLFPLTSTPSTLEAVSRTPLLPSSVDRSYQLASVRDCPGKPLIRAHRLPRLVDYLSF